MTVNELIKLCKDKDLSLDTPVYYLDSSGEHRYPIYFAMRKEDLTDEEIEDMGEEAVNELPYICVGN